GYGRDVRLAQVDVAQRRRHQARQRGNGPFPQDHQVPGHLFFLPQRRGDEVGRLAAVGHRPPVTVLAQEAQLLLGGRPVAPPSLLAAGHAGSRLVVTRIEGRPGRDFGQRRRRWRRRKRWLVVIVIHDAPSRYGEPFAEGG